MFKLHHLEQGSPTGGLQPNQYWGGVLNVLHTLCMWWYTNVSQVWNDIVLVKCYICLGFLWSICSLQMICNYVLTPIIVQWLKLVNDPWSSENDDNSLAQDIHIPFKKNIFSSSVGYPSEQSAFINHNQTQRPLNYGHTWCVIVSCLHIRIFVAVCLHKGSAARVTESSVGGPLVAHWGTTILLMSMYHNSATEQQDMTVIYRITDPGAALWKWREGIQYTI